MAGGKRKQRKPEGDVSNLPCDIIFSILLKSSVKSLLRFRCVCKSLLAIISEPQFVRSHLNESIKLDRQRIFRSDSRSDYFYSTGYGGGDDLEQKLCFPRKKSVWPHWRQKARVVCSCNGLVLLDFDNKTCALWYPSTIAYKRLSCPHNWRLLPRYTPPYDCPSDSDCDSDDKGNWRLARVAYVRPHSPTYLSSIFSRDSYLSSSDCGRQRFDESSRYEGIHGTYMIVYYDVVNEEFKEMPPPNCINKGNIFRLTVMRGCLSIYCNIGDQKYVEVWTMKQYGEHNSWTKLFVISRWVGATHLGHVMPLCATEKGEVVIIIDERRIAIYNPIKNKFRSLRHTKIDQYPGPVLVVDSLVLPIGNGAPQVKGKRKWEL
ncbi:F-box/kelch-repeat protein At3g23880-like [Cornus florida]|uniref:F-box/kelch-repeat protein At3g23880-like n=1 Tax=Cornus florida TaxID=4283 RepID=UPI00289A5341|nr:F-box/kelch-repeat protein At3g23880-like [Cornus florida]